MATATTPTRSDAPAVPSAAESLEGFRLWLRSGSFPERGRVDFLQGEVDVDVSPEDLYTHGTPKAEIASVLQEYVARPSRGWVFIDRTRVTIPSADLSVEPDVVVVLCSTFEEKRAVEVPAASGLPGRFCEIEGPPDLIVEVVSDSSVRKDVVRLPRLYERAGVGELWIVDARGEEISLDLRVLGSKGYRPADQEDGWQYSPLLDRGVRLYRESLSAGRFKYTLATRRRLLSIS